MGREKSAMGPEVASASGLKWVNMGLEVPPGMRPMINDKLSAELLHRSTEYIKRDEKKGTKEIHRRIHDRQEVTFTAAEWQKFKVPDLRIDQYVKGDAMRYFITLEKRVQAKEDLKLSRALCEAAINGDSRLAINMISARASVEARDNFQNTPLILATINGHMEVAKILIDAGASINARNKLGDSPLSKASIKGHERIVRMLLDLDANSENKDNFGETPLMVAAYNNNLGVARMLVEAKVDVNARDNDGGTALILAAFFNHMGVAKLLLNAGANKKLKDRQSQNALKYAESASHKPMMKLLRGD